MNNSVSPRENFILKEYLRAIWRRKWLILLFGILVTAITVGATLLFEEPKYQSTAEMLQRRSGLDKALLGADVFEQGYQPERDIQTAAEMMQSTPVSIAVENNLGDRLNGNNPITFITTSVVKKADILDVTATANEPQLAADIANSFAVEYINWRRSADQKILQQARAPIEAQIAATPPEQQETSGFKILKDKLESIKVVEAMQTGNLELVKPAVASTIPVSPKPVRTGFIAFLVSIFAASVAALFIEQFDTKIRNTDQITEKLNKPILATVPKFANNGSLITLSDPSGVSSEAYRMLKTNLGFIEPDKAIKTILVSSAQPGEGKSTTIANLAVTMARAGQRVIIIEADLRRPTLSNALGLDNSIGITNAISGSCTLRETLQMIEASNIAIEGFSEPLTTTINGLAIEGVKPIYCATAGPLPPNPGEIASSKKLGSLILEASNYADVVLVDAPPFAIVGDAASIAAKVDGIMLVVRLSHTSKKSLDMMDEFITTIPSNVLGIVVTNSSAGDSKSKSYGGYYADRSGYYE